MSWLIVALIVIVVLALGFAIGMLVAGPLSRWLDRDDEEPHDV
jgi:Kef-type K+ transport system membrane component KefB